MTNIDTCSNNNDSSLDEECTLEYPVLTNPLFDRLIQDLFLLKKELKLKNLYKGRYRPVDEKLFEIELRKSIIDSLTKLDFLKS